jgi:hypothetical protein
MSILSIDRFFSGNPNIVGILTDDNFATITAVDYWKTQQPIIQQLINGEFQWSISDLVLIYYATNQIGFFTYDENNLTFAPLNEAGDVSAVIGTQNQVLVDGTFGVPKTGSPILTTPQDIGTTSNPSFASVKGGNLKLSENKLSSTDTNGDICFTPNGNGQVLAFTTTPFNDISPLAVQSLQPYSRCRYGNIAESFSFQGFASNSMVQGVFSKLQVGDPIASVVAYGDDGVQFSEGGLAEFVVEGPVSSGIMPCSYEIWTTNTLGQRKHGFKLDKNQVVVLDNPLPAISGGTGITSLGTGVSTALGQNVTGSGGIALKTSPVFVTPTLGEAVATSINFGGSSLSTYSQLTAWTPVVTFTSPGDLSVAYGTQTGSYSRIGNIVVVTFNLIFTPTYTTSTGNLNITGLPFTVNAGCYGTGLLVTSGITFPAGTTSLVGSAFPATTLIIFTGIGTAGNGLVTVTNVVSGTQKIVQGTLTYLV